MFNVSIYACSTRGEVPQGRSELIPNQALSIRQIIERSSRGQILAEVQGNQLQYGDDEDEEGVDLFDPDDDKFDVRDKLSYYEQRLASAKAEKEAYEKQKNEEAKKAEAKPEADDAADDLAK